MHGTEKKPASSSIHHPSPIVHHSRAPVLTELRIADFAVIEELHLTFSSGFHVLTGETGAGKSILVDALALLVGGRASSEQIRSGSEEAVLEATFTLPPKSTT